MLLLCEWMKKIRLPIHTRGRVRISTGNGSCDGGQECDKRAAAAKDPTDVADAPGAESFDSIQSSKSFETSDGNLNVFCGDLWLVRVKMASGFVVSSSIEDIQNCTETTHSTP